MDGREAWLQLRLGKVTASRVADAVARTKKGEPMAVRTNYMMQLLAERFTGKPYETYRSAAMEWGLAYEPIAKECYSDFTGIEIEGIGFVPHPSIVDAGATPDGLIGKAGLVELKCPTAPTHLGLLTGDPIPRNYELQMLWQMECTGRQWCDFVSFHPDMPSEAQLYIKRVDYDADARDELVYEVCMFLEELQAKENRVREWKYTYA